MSAVTAMRVVLVEVDGVTAGTATVGTVVGDSTGEAAATGTNVGPPFLELA